MNETSFGREPTQWLKNPVAERSERLQPMREILLRPYFGQRRRIKIFHTKYRIGSSADCEIRIDDPFVSPVHAEILLEEGGRGYTVSDCGSRNGVFLNGVRVGSAPLPEQGTLRLGRSHLCWAEEQETGMPEGPWVVADPLMRETVESVRRMARSSLPVLLLGETGTGKDVLANMLHLWGLASGAPFVAVNGALLGGTLAESELFGHRKGAFTGADTHRLGALRSAHGGTLFLDEVGDLPPSAQVKLLRALETGEVKALGADRAEKVELRLVSATSRDLDCRLRDGSFRLDLYYRIAGFVVRVPPLRERPLDITAIARKLAQEKGLGLEREAESKLLSYPWPGNVRELRSCMERAAVLAKCERIPAIASEHLVGLGHGSSPPHPAGRPLTLEQMERDCILAALERNGWSRGMTARELGLARSTLFEKMRRYGIKSSVNAGAPEGEEAFASITAP